MFLFIMTVFLKVPYGLSGLENSMDCIVHGVAKSWTRLSDFHFTSFHGLSDEGGKCSQNSTQRTGVG